MTAHLAARALGPENVARRADARARSRRSTASPTREALGAQPRHRGAHRATSTRSTRTTSSSSAACSARRRATGSPQENVQARIRGALLMAVSNAEDRLVLATGNKSELCDRLLHALRRHSSAGSRCSATSKARRLRARAARQPRRRAHPARLDRQAAVGRARARTSTTGQPAAVPGARRGAAAGDRARPARRRDRAAGRRDARDGRVDPEADRPQRVQAPPGAASCCASRRRPTARAGAFRSCIAAAGASSPIDYVACGSLRASLRSACDLAQGGLARSSLRCSSSRAAARGCARTRTRAGCRSGDTRRRRCAGSRSARTSPCAGSTRDEFPAILREDAGALLDPVQTRPRARRLRGARPAPAGPRPRRRAREADRARGRRHLQPARAHALRRGRDRPECRRPERAHAGGRARAGARAAAPALPAADAADDPRCARTTT